MGWLENWLDNLFMGGDEGKAIDMSLIEEKIPIDKYLAEGKKRIEEARKENEEEEKAEEGLKHVIDTAKLKCDLCVTPIGDLKVNYDTPTIQDKKIATIKERDITSLIFKGNCKKSTNSSSPCASVMQLGEWKDIGTSLIQDQPPLLLKSTIKCNYGGADITINDCGQKFEPEEIDVVGAPVSEVGGEKLDFIVYPRIFKDNPWIYNYFFDWNRNNDKYFNIRSTNENEIFENCIKGKDLFLKHYIEGETVINNKKYFPPYLRIFKNHEIITKQDVVLSLYITFEDSKKIINEKIVLEYDESVMDVGFTDDGKIINNKEFVFEKKYFNDDYYSLNDHDEERKSEYEVIITNEKNEKFIILNKLIIKCRETFSENKQIKFLNSKKEIVGVLVVKPNEKMILSKREFKYIKIKRKSFGNRDLENVKKNIIESYIQDEKGKEVNFENENEFLQKFTETLVNRYFSRLGVNFSTNISIGEVEIDEKYLIEKQIITDNNVLNGSKYLEFVQEKYLKKKNISDEEYKKSILIFISPIKELPKGIETKAAFVIYENVYSFSSMVYSFEADTLVHEIGHEMGLKHPFETTSENLEKKQKKLKILKDNRSIYDQNEILYSKWQKDYDTRAFKQYPFKLGKDTIVNKVNWKERIDLEKSENNIKREDNLYKIKSLEELIEFYTKIEEYHQIYFNKGKTDNIMDYSPFKYGFFDYQYDIITKLNEEFKHI